MKNSNISRKVKQLRNETGISQEELSVKTGLSLRTIQRIENNETDARNDSINRISNFFNVNLNNESSINEKVNLLRIKRKESGWGCMKDFSIYINDIKVGKIANGDIREFFLENDIHSVDIRASWFEKSQKHFIDLTNLETKTIKVSYSKIIIYTSLIMIFSTLLTAIGLYFHLFNISFLTKIVVVSGLTYIVVFGRKNTLILKELN